MILIGRMYLLALPQWKSEPMPRTFNFKLSSNSGIGILFLIVILKLRSLLSPKNDLKLAICYSPVR